MRRSLIFIILLVSFCRPLRAQGFTDSNLPIVIINTDLYAEIPDNPRILASMKIIYRGPGQRNYLTDQNNPAYLNYNGRINIEIRGSSSQARPKKQYGFTTLLADNITNNNVHLLGMPSENDWIFNGMIFDPALMRDYLSYNLSRQIGEYASRTAYCELVINGVYKGLYLLQEKIKADENRVNVIQIDKLDNSFPDISGGYITKADKTTGGDPVAWNMLSTGGATVTYIHDLPSPADVTSLQNTYIRKQFLILERTAMIGDTSVTGGYPSVIDLPSFINYMLISELGSNSDSYMFSTFFHKDKNGKLRAGPIWDNDLTYGNDLFFWGLDRSKSNLWQFANGDNEGSRFWRDLFNNPWFKCCLAKRWNELTGPGQPLSIASLNSFIDKTAAEIGEAVKRDYILWGTVGDPQQKINEIKTFIAARIPWITANLGSFSDCQVSVPPLVITKIMFHPLISVQFPDGEDLEFIEILNNGDQAVNMSGVYFSGTGFVYGFPANSKLRPRSSVILASNPAVFFARYGVAPYGNFTRHLSNKDQELVLADAFGNVIDRVHYFDTIPWPEADGNGRYLKLTDPALDNNLATSWTASNDLIVSDNNIPDDFDLQLYPNPVRDILRIRSPREIKNITLLDITGVVIVDVQVNCETYDLDMSRLMKGIYLVRVNTGLKTTTSKVIKS